MDETMPIPVTTTRRMANSFKLVCFDVRWAALRLKVQRPPKRALAPTSVDENVSAPISASASTAGGHLVGLEQPDPQVLGFVDASAVGLEPAVRDAQHKL